MICGRNRLGKKFENYWVVCLYFEFWKELSFFDLEIFCKIGVFCNKMSISLRQILGSEPWATLAQLSLIFGLSFAFAGRVVKRHGELSSVLSQRRSGYGFLQLSKSAILISPILRRKDDAKAHTTLVTAKNVKFLIEFWRRNRINYQCTYWQYCNQIIGLKTDAFSRKTL